MSRKTFRDFDEFADSIDGIAGRFAPTKPSESEWWIQQMPAGQVSLQQVRIGGAATFTGGGQAHSLTLGLPMSDPLRIQINGGSLDDQTILFLNETQPFTFASAGATLWTGITVPLDNLMLACGPDVCDPIVLRRMSAVARARLLPEDVTRLRELAARLADSDPMIVLDDPVAARFAEEEIALRVMQSIERCEPINESRLTHIYRQRQRVIGRALELVEANESQPLYISDLCRVTGVSERTLRNIFLAFFGVSPMRLIKLRQLREVRAALAVANPERDTVVKIAARFGIWDLSLFASDYRRLFNESPSQTLRAPPTRAKVGDSVSWLKCATQAFFPHRPRAGGGQMHL